MIRRLSRSQICAYLNQAGESLAGVRWVLRHDETLWELLDTPLMLGIVALTYRGQAAAEMISAGSPEQRRKHLFANYVQQMFKRRVPTTAYKPEQTIFWLSWLAKLFVKDGLSIFYLEWMQPESCAQRWAVAILPSMFSGVLSAFILWMFAVFRLDHLAFDMRVHFAVAIFLIVIFGLVASLLYAKGVRLEQITPVEALRWSWQGSTKGFRRSLVHAVLFGLTVGLILFVLLVLFRGTSELLAKLLAGLLWGLYLGLLYAVPFGLTQGLWRGLTTFQLVTRTTPNEGIRRSLRLVLALFLPLGLAIWLIMWLTAAVLPGASASVQAGMDTGPLAALEALCAAVAMQGGLKGLWLDSFVILWVIFGMRQGGFTVISTTSSA